MISSFFSFVLRYVHKTLFKVPAQELESEMSDLLAQSVSW